MVSRGNLPADAGGFVGRADDLARIDERVDGGARLITLTGPGGIGKTRLAIRWASARRERFPGGAWLVDLAPARDRGALSVAVARALDVPLRASDDAEAEALVARQLAAHGRALLVLDNLEQVAAEGAAAIARWHEVAHEAVFVVTSRESLQISAEHCWELAPIALPEEHAPSSEIAASEAFALLADRVRRRRGRWDPDARELEAAGALLRRLDGIPLAIELAAARLATEGTASLLDRLGRSIDALGSGPRDRTERQRTLRRAIEWSLEMLAEDELDAFALSAVFAGGFAREDAEAVLPLARAGELVLSLRARSLLRGYEPREAPGEVRLGTYETIGAIAEERFGAHPLAAETRARHARHYVERCEALAERVAEGRGGREAVQRLALEQENLLAAAAYLARERADESERSLAFRCVLALDPVLSVQGLFARKVELYDRLLGARDARHDDETDGAVEPRLRARALEGRGLSLHTLGRRAEGRADMEHALEIARAVGERVLEGRLLYEIARTTWTADEVALAQLEQSIAILEEVGDLRQLATAIDTLGVKRYELGQRAEGEALFARSQRMFREVGDVRWEGIAWCQLALIAIEAARVADAERALAEASACAARDGAWNLGVMVEQARGSLCHLASRLDEAAERYEEVLRVHRRVANRAFEGMYLGYLGLVERERGRYAEARARMEQACEVLAGVGESHHRALFLAHLGGLEAELDREDAARARLAEAEALRGGAKMPGLATVLELERAWIDLARARRASTEGDRRAARAARESAARTLERALALEPSESAAIEVRIARRMIERALGAARPPSLPPPPALPSAPPHDEPPPPHATASERAPLRVQRDAAWFAMPGGERVGCAGRHVARRLLVALMEARLSSPGEPIPPRALLEAGWPGERIHPEAARNRLHVAISTLRKLGLRDALQNAGDGYRLDPDLPLELAD